MAHLTEHSLSTHRRNELLNITGPVQQAVKDSGIAEGICVIFVPHTTAGVTINENADPDVTLDINTFLAKLIPENSGFHHMEGNSDGHIKSSLFGPSLTVIIHEGRPVLGTWQGIYFAEFDGPRHRKYIVKCLED